MNDSKYNEMAQILDGFRINGIRQSGKQLETVLRFQDIIGTSTKDDLIEMWTKQMELDPNLKRVFIWAVTSTCGFEMAQSVIEYTMGLDVKKSFQAQFERHTANWKQIQSNCVPSGTSLTKKSVSRRFCKTNKIRYLRYLQKIIKK